MNHQRIALFLPSLRGGGAERVMVNLARAFTERGLQVDLVLAKAEGPYLSHVPSEVRIVDLQAPRVLVSFPGLVRYLRRECPRALLAALDHTNVLAIWARRLAGVPTRVVVSIHSNLSKATAGACSLRGRLMPLLVELTYPLADAVIAVSQGVAEDLMRLARLSPDKVEIIYNPVVTPDLFEKAEEPLEHPWFAPGEPPVVLGVGRLTPAKDFRTLIRAFALVRKQCPARLMILGEGEERPVLEALVRELGVDNDVSLPGFVDNPYAYMKRARVFVLSSAWEGFGNVLVEAMALGTPVVATNCRSGPNEVLEGGKWGRLVPVGDVDALAHAILAAMADKRGKAVERARCFVLEEIATRYAEILGVAE